MFDTVTPAWILAVLSIAGIVGGMVIGWVKYRLSDEFAKKADVAGVGAGVAGLSTRVEAVERHIQTVPTHNDMRLLGERIAAVERGVAVVSAEMRGVGAGVARVENDLSLIKRHLIKEANP